MVKLLSGLVFFTARVIQLHAFSLEASADALLSASLAPDSEEPGTLPRPHIVYILADDLGWNDVGYRNARVKTPWINTLASLGIRLESHYSYKRCAPARAALLTGRDGYRHGAARLNLPPLVPEGVDLSYKMLPAALKAGGYRTHMLGKWHQGFFATPYRPSNRGFDTFHGYFSGQEDHYTQEIEAACDWGHAKDLHTNNGLATADIGNYNTARWADMAVKIIEEHNKTEPMFLYVSLQNAHAPLQAPPEVVSHHSFSAEEGGEARQIHAAMLSMVDATVANITNALVREEMWGSTLLVWASDNGARVTLAGSNAPLRGGKNSNWEGGVRTPALVTGGIVPTAMHGRKLRGLFSITDWYSTLAHAAEVPLDDGGVVPIESINLWPYLMGREDESPRETIVHDHMYERPEPGLPITQATGALRYRSWKLVVGPERLPGWYGEWGPLHPDVPQESESEEAAAGGGECSERPCLFHIEKDPEEREDLSESNPDEYKSLLRRWEALMSEYHPPLDGPAIDAERACKAWAYSGGFVVPWVREDPGVAPPEQQFPAIPVVAAPPAVVPSPLPSASASEASQHGEDASASSRRRRRRRHTAESSSMGNSSDDRSVSNSSTATSNSTTNFTEKVDMAVADMLTYEKSSRSDSSSGTSGSDGGESVSMASKHSPSSSKVQAPSRRRRRKSSTTFLSFGY